MYYYRIAYEMRWDLLAYLAWGDAYMMDELLDANQNIGVYTFLPKDIVISVPINLNSAIIANTALLPLWKQ